MTLNRRSARPAWNGILKFVAGSIRFLFCGNEHGILRNRECAPE